MKTTKICSAVVMAGLFFGACASTGSRFGKLYPGMTSDQIAKTMDKAPNRVEEFPQGYASWYYGEDRCLLLKDDKIVSKAETESKDIIDIPWGGMKEKKTAECVPPYIKKSTKVEREIETPIGTVRH